MTITASRKEAKTFHPAAVALLAGCAWILAGAFPASTPALAAAAATAAAAQPSDATLQADVLSAIQADGSLKGQRISATVSKGVVKLTGTVETQAESERAETDAVGVSGISGILNQLKITHPGASTPSAGIAAQSAANELAPESETPATSPTTANTQQPTGAQASAPPPPPDTAQQPQSQQPPQTRQPTYAPPQEGQYRQPYYGNPRSPYSEYGRQNNGYRQPGYQARQRPEIPYYATPKSPVTIPAGAFLRARLSQPLNSARIEPGTYFEATAASDVYEGGVLAIPRGAELTGQVVAVKRGGRLAGSSAMSLRLTSVALSGKTYPLASDVWSSRSPSKTEHTAGNTAGGAILGALIGGIVGGGGGAAVGATVGGIGGLAASGASRGPEVYLPTEAVLSFRLTAPATVEPVPWQEAERLAASAPQPTLVRRPPPAYAVPPSYYGPYYRPYYGPYPYPYYRMYP